MARPIAEYVERVLQDGKPRTAQQIIDNDHNLRHQSPRVIGQVAKRIPNVVGTGKVDVKDYALKRKDVMVWEWRV